MRPSLILFEWMWAGFAWAYICLPAKCDVSVVFQMDLHPSSSIVSRLQRRNSRTLQVMTNDWHGQDVNISVGTPPQPLIALVDIQDSGLSIFAEYANTKKVISCDDVDRCSLLGHYDPSKSSSNGTVEISDPLGSAHPYIQPTDKLTIGGAELEDVGLEYVKLTTSHVNTIGLGPRNTSLPYRMADQGFIQSPSFSVWSNITENGHGGLLFGGVNTAKYRGPLQAYPFSKYQEGVSIPLEKVQVQPGSGTTKDYTFPSKPYLLSSVQTNTYLPNDTVQLMYKDYNISWIGFKGSDPEFGTLDCDRRNTENHTVSLVFGDAIISAPWGDLIMPWISPGICLFNIQPSSEGVFDHDLYGGYIGTIFTHRMYIAVNYKTRFVGVAAMNHHPGPDHIVEINAGSILPDAVEYSSSSVPSHTGGTAIIATSTSMGLAAMHTMPVVHKLGPFSGVAVMVFLAVL